MKSKNWMLMVGLVMALASGCVKETVIVEPARVTDADVYYEFTADEYGTIVQGDVYNDGNTFINAVELEIRLYDRRGYIIDYEYVWVDTYIHPGEGTTYYFDLPHRGVWDVVVRINRYD